MTSIFTSFHFQRTALAVAVCTAFAPVQALAEDDASSAAVTTISVGLGAVDGSRADRAVFGQYNGLRDQSAVGMVDVDYSLRKQDTSTWVDFKGSSLLGDTRDLGLVWKNPGSWKLTAEYGELVHYDPNTVNTGLLGAGSTAPQVVVVLPGAGSDLELKTKRTGLGVGFTKIISPALQFQVDLKSEDKKGSRLFGLGMICSPLITPSCGAAPGGAVFMLPEPIDANHSQVEARVSYALERLRLSAGYYGSFYRNNNTALQPGLGAFSSPDLAGLNQPLALAPDNQAHQVDLSGSYDFTRTTRGTFKLGYAKATQNADFASAGLAGPVGVTNLGGEVNTTLAKIGFTSRPMPKLSLVADLRYEDKDDQTPLANYNTVGLNTPTVFATNRNLSNKKIQGKLQASWQFSSDYRGTLGADYESIDRGVFTASSSLSGFVPLRQDTTEAGVRAELRRRLTDDVSGSISLSSSRRDGSNWLQGTSGTGVTEVADPATSLSSAIFMPTLADRRRDKIKLFADWQASEKLSLQFSAEEGLDKFSTPSAYGLQEARMNQLSVDWGYALSDNWALNGYLSHSGQTLNQSRYAGYVMAFDNTNLGASIGVTGKASSKLQVGGSLSYTDDKSVYAQSLDAAADAYARTLLSTGGLPDVVYRQTALKLFGNYALEKGSSIRVDLVHQRVSVNDWAWGNDGVPFAYSDGTTVTQSANQNVSFIGVTYIYLLK